MTTDEMTELIDLYVADELPDTLRAFVATYLNTHPEAAYDAETLRASLTQLRTAPAERPDAWFTERLLNTLLREQSTEIVLTRGA
jgi:anti-sigma factor RsiW